MKARNVSFKELESAITFSLEKAKISLADSPKSLHDNLVEGIGFIRGVCFVKGVEWETKAESLITLIEDELAIVRKSLK